MDETGLSHLARGYILKNLSSATFQAFVAEFERFTFGVLIAWLTEYPGSLSEKQLEFETVLNAKSIDDIIAQVARKELYDISYKTVKEWFEYFEKRAKLGCPTQFQVRRISEIKATRDILVHNNGIANETYVRKSMGLARAAVGEPLELPAQYHLDSWNLIKGVIAEIAEAATQKVAKG